MKQIIFSGHNFSVLWYNLMYIGGFVCCWEFASFEESFYVIVPCCLSISIILHVFCRLEECHPNNKINPHVVEKFHYLNFFSLTHLPSETNNEKHSRLILETGIDYYQLVQSQNSTISIIQYLCQLSIN